MSTEFLISMLLVAASFILFGTVVSNPLIGKSRQSMGGATFSKWKNLNILKTKAFPHNPRTTKQSANRTRFKYATLTFRRLLDIEKEGFPSKTGKMTELNASIQLNLKNAIAVNLVFPFAPTWTKANVGFSSGPIDNVLSPVIANNTIAGFQVTWTDNSNGTTAQSTDVARVIILDQTYTVIGTKSFYDSFGIVQNDLRSGLNVSKSLPAIWSGRTVDVYIFMKRYSTISNPNEASDTFHIGSTGLI